MGLPSRLFEVLVRHRRTPFLARLSAYTQAMRPGDRFILAILGCVVAVLSIANLYALERSMLVRVPMHGGSLSEGIVGTPRFVNPLLALSDADHDLVALTYAGLMGLDEYGALVPVLADHYTVSADGKTYTFVLKQNAKFSDGTSVTADDVVYTVGKAQDPGLKSPQRANWANVRAEVVDARTVRFTLPQAYAPFLEDATLGILPAHLWKTVTNNEFPFSDRTFTPVGAGPFRVSKVTHAKNGTITGYTLSANKYYALGEPYLSSIRFTFFDTEQTLAQALKKGTVESGYGVPNVTALKAPYSRVFGVFFNPAQNSVFARIEVRKALSLALDRDAIVNGILGGYATALIGPVPPGSGISEPGVPSKSSHLADARKTLTDAGWAYSESEKVWKNAKQKLTLNSLTLTTSNAPELKLLASNIQTDWEALGVPVSIELYDPSALTQSVIRPRKYEALLFGMVIGHSKDLYPFWHSTQKTDPGLNIAEYGSTNVDSLLEKLRTDRDQFTTGADLQQISDSIAADYPAAFTHAPDFLYTVPKDVRDIRLPQIASPSDRFAGVSHWYRESELVWPFLVQSR